MYLPLFSLTQDQRQWVELHLTSVGIGSFLLHKSQYVRLVYSKIHFQSCFTDLYLIVMFFSLKKYTLFKSGVELQPNLNYFNQESSLPYLWLKPLIRKRKLRIGDKTAYWMRWIWWDSEVISLVNSESMSLLQW